MKSKSKISKNTSCVKIEEVHLDTSHQISFERVENIAKTKSEKSKNISAFEVKDIHISLSQQNNFEHENIMKTKSENISAVEIDEVHIIYSNVSGNVSTEKNPPKLADIQSFLLTQFIAHDNAIKNIAFMNLVDNVTCKKMKAIQVAAHKRFNDEYKEIKTTKSKETCIIYNSTMFKKVKYTAKYEHSKDSKLIDRYIDALFSHRGSGEKIVMIAYHDEREESLNDK